MFDAECVYLAQILAASEGVDCSEYPIEDDGYKSSFNQGIARKYGKKAKELGYQECWKRYQDSLSR